MYKSVGTPVIGELLVCKQEQHNIHDPFAVAVYKGSIIVGHISRRISAMCHTFLGNSWCSITCKITGHRRYVRDSPKGGVEVPCHLIFHGEEFDIEKIRSLVQHKIKIVDGYSEKEIAEIIKGVISEDVILVKNESAETYSQYSSDQYGDNYLITEYNATPIKTEIEDPEMNSIKQAAALGSEDTAENPETYSV